MRLLKPITGLVSAIDFRHNGKDAWYRTAGSLAGTLQGTATIVNGGLLCDADGEGLTFVVGAAAQIPGVAGCIIADVTVPAASTVDGWYLDLKPASATSNNRILLGKRRSGVGSLGQSGIFTSAAAEKQSQTAAELGAGRKVLTTSWSGWNGSAGTASRWLSIDGATPVATTGETWTRTEADTDGVICVGNDRSLGAEEWRSSVHRFAIFNVTNPAGIDTTAAHSTSAIFDAIFPRTRLNGMST